MLAFWRRHRAGDAVDRLHERIVACSRAPAFYETGVLPDTVEGRFESLALHVLLVLRRLRALPPPADEVGQELVDRVFAHLEIALREIGIGDMGVPKRMKKIAGAFYDRTRLYDPHIAAGDAQGLAAEIAGHLGRDPGTVLPLARFCLASEGTLSRCTLDDLLGGTHFAGYEYKEAEVVA